MRAGWSIIFAMEVQQQTSDTLRRQVLNLLLSKKVMATPQRLDVGEVLFAKRQHLSAEQILDALHGHGKSVSKATVYNTLGLFVERGLLNTVHVDPTRVVYDTTCEPHHHIFNVSTGELSDVPFGELEIRDLPALPPGTVVDGVEVLIRVRPTA